MNIRTRNYIKSRFQQYYRKANITIPSHLENREWGIISFDEMPETVMRRHKSFETSAQVSDYLSAMAPAHVYHSVACYRYPNAPTMKEKQWIQADLIFDLDADHLPDAKKNYADMLHHVKEETLKLYDFLISDFGFSEEYIKIVFSGGRGYHFHITDPRVLSLESAHRREIVDYISGRGLDMDNIITKKAIIGDVGSENASRLSLPSQDEGGWGARINHYIVSYLENIAKTGDAKKRFMKFEGIGKTSAEKLVTIFQDREQIEKIKKGNIDPLSTINRSFLHHLADDAVLFNRASVDEPVTGDIKRLIRLPGSLHGKSGMQVKELTISTLEEFEPLNDAIAFSDKPVKLKLMKPFSVQMRGNDLQLEEGRHELPEYAAIYLMCRGVAEYGS